MQYPNSHIACVPTFKHSSFEFMNRPMVLIALSDRAVVFKLNSLDRPIMADVLGE